MAVTFIGQTEGRPIELIPLENGPVADGDWIIYLNYYPSFMTSAIVDVSGWVMLEKTVGTVGTVEVWVRQWHTGDPTSWTVNVTGFAGFTHPDKGYNVVFRGLVAPPTLSSTPHITPGPPGIADPISNLSIGNNDVALGFFVGDEGQPGLGTFNYAEGSIVTGAPFGMGIYWGRTGISGAAPGGDIDWFPSNSTEVFGVQVVLPDAPILPPPPPRSLIPRKPGRGRLGCGENQAYLTWRCGTPRFCPLPTASEVTWSRHLNDISEAQVVIPLSGNADETCCDCLGDVEPWCHELHIARDGEDVWLGPVTEIVYEFDKVTIRALDVLGWATVRVAEVDIDYTVATGAGPADWTTMAQAVLDVAFAEDDPCILPYVSASLSGYVGEQKFPAYTDSAFDQLDQLAGTGLEYTVVGRTIILASPNVPTTPIATLMDEHILGAVQLTKTGLLQADRWFVHFDKDTEAIPPGPGFAEAPNQYCYGLLERIRSTDTALANVESAEIVAGVYVAAASIAPRLLEIPDGSQLSPEAPWTIDQMIPGCRVDVGVTRLCVDATQSFVLAGVGVRQTKDGEEVTVTLGPLNLPTGGL